MARTPAAKSETKPKRPKRPPAIKERMTKAAMVQEMAERTELSKGQVESVLSELESVIERHVRSRAAGEFVLPGLFKVSRAKRKAQKKKTGRNPATGEEIVIPAKPGADGHPRAGSEAPARHGIATLPVAFDGGSHAQRLPPAGPLAAAVQQWTGLRRQGILLR